MGEGVNSIILVTLIIIGILGSNTIKDAGAVLSPDPTNMPGGHLIFNEAQFLQGVTMQNLTVPITLKIQIELHPPPAPVAPRLQASGTPLHEEEVMQNYTFNSLFESSMNYAGKPASRYIKWKLTNTTTQYNSVLDDLQCDPSYWTCKISVLTDKYIEINKVVSINSAPFKPTDGCKVSLKQITGIVDVLQKFIDQQAKSEHASIQTQDAGSADQCQQEVQNIINLIDKLMSSYTKLVNANKSNIGSEEYQKMKNTYQEQNNELTQRITDIKREADQGAAKILEEMDRKGAEFKKKYDDLVQQLEDEISARQEELVQTIGGAIHRGNLPYAISKFQVLIKKNQITEIVKVAYSSSKVEEIIIFLAAMSSEWLVYRAQALETLVTVMESNQHMESPASIALMKYISVLRRTRNKDLESSEILERLYHKVQNWEERVTANWADQIVAENFDQALYFMEGRHGISYSLGRELTKIAWLASNQGHKPAVLANTIIDFALKLDAGIGEEVWQELFNQMEASDKIIFGPAQRIAYNEFKKNGLESELWRKFPPHWKAMMNGDLVCLFTQLNYKYQVIVDEHMDSDRDRVTSTNWRRSNAHTTKWRMDTGDGGKTWRFRTGEENNNYMYAAATSYDQGGRKVLTWRDGKPQPEGDWILTPEYGDKYWKQNQYIIGNTYVDEFLILDQKEEIEHDLFWIRRDPNSVGKRRVLTRKQTYGDLSRFEIEPC